MSNTITRSASAVLLSILLLFMTAQITILMGFEPVSAAATPNQNGRNAKGVAMSSANNTQPSDSFIATTVSTTSQPTVVLSVANSNENDNGNPAHQPIADATNQTGSKESKIAICHRTASITNPYVKIEVATAAVDGIAGNSGNSADHFGEHTGPVFSQSIANEKNWGDIIPPVNGAHNGTNWSAAGQAVYNNGCKITTQSTATPSKPDQNAKEGTVSLCHATGSVSNPFVKITIATAGAYNGHIGHRDSKDIIPPFSFNGQSYSQNWDSTSQAIFNNGCKVPQTATPSQQPATASPTDHGEILSAATTTAAPAELAKTGGQAIVGLVAGIALIASSIVLSLINRHKQTL